MPSYAPIALVAVAALGLAPSALAAPTAQDLIGAAAPAFSLPADDGKTVSLSDYHAKQVAILAFFPKAFTPGCTAESKRFRDNHAELQALGAEVVGVSRDDLAVQCDFSQKLGLKYPLLADTDHKLVDAYGVGWALLGLPKRVTFVIDPQGIVRAVFHHEFRVSKHLDDVVRFLEKARAGAA